MILERGFCGISNLYRSTVIAVKASQVSRPRSPKCCICHLIEYEMEPSEYIFGMLLLHHITPNDGDAGIRFAKSK